MNFEEKMDRLEARHEVLTQSIELVLIETRELREASTLHYKSLEKDSEHIHALVRVAEAHERRISRLEGHEPTN
ncbi:MAG TPA: hypothetical protein VKS01_02280 [Bryobacteraceae bacterium]|nr:hypothetical protein [Bryobacteraceae bacterium]